MIHIFNYETEQWSVMSFQLNPDVIPLYEGSLSLEHDGEKVY